MRPLDKPVYTGERLTLNFQDIETRAVLQLLADASGQNIVVSDSVNGSVTLRLQNVPWDQALDIVLRTKGLDKRTPGQRDHRRPAGGARRPREGRACRAQGRAGARAAALRVPAGELRQGGRTGQPGEDADTNSTALAARQCLRRRAHQHVAAAWTLRTGSADIRRLVATLDIPVRQVQIEARIVIVNDDFQRQLGARFGFTNVQQNGNTGLVTTTGTAAGTDQDHQLGDRQRAEQHSAVDLSDLGAHGRHSPPARYNVNLPVSFAGRHVRPGHPWQQLHRGPGAVRGPGGDGGEYHLQARA